MGDSTDALLSRLWHYVGVGNGFDVNDFMLLLLREKKVRTSVFDPLVVMLRSRPSIGNHYRASSRPREAYMSCKADEGFFLKHPVGDPLIARLGSRPRIGNHSRARTRPRKA